MSGRLLLYGATGHSGRLLAERLADLGTDLILAGRNEAGLADLAGSLGLSFRSFELDAAASIDQGLRSVAVVVNAAGPFAATAGPLIDGCLRAGIDYLDIAGEWPVFDHAVALAGEAERTGSMLMPGIGFGIAVTDCLLALAAKRTPGAVRLRLGLSMPHAMSRGSLATVIELADPEVLVRRDGALRGVRAGTLGHDFDFGAGSERAMAVSWPDVVTAQISTGVANVEVFSRISRMARLATPISVALSPLWSRRGVRQAMRRAVVVWPDPPHSTGFTLVAEAEDQWRRTTTVRLATLDGYATTTVIADAIARQVLNGRRRPGFVTPSGLLGAEFILTLPEAIADIPAGPVSAQEKRHAVR